MAITEGKPQSAQSAAVAITVAILAALASLGVGYFQFLARRTTDNLSRTVAESSRQVQVLSVGVVGPLERGQKLCRVLRGSTWRDGIIVPQNWTVRLCEDYMRKTGGTDYQLGCIYTDGTNLALPARAIPSPNCGWQ
jgi:hypothetical protein